MLTGFFCHPRYAATRADGSPVMRLTKQPAFFEGRFQIDRPGELRQSRKRGRIISHPAVVRLLGNSRIASFSNASPRLVQI
jgi:hypothetical protein